MTVDVYADLPSDIATGTLTVVISDIMLDDTENDIEFTKGPLGAETFTVHDSATVVATTNSANPATLTLVPNATEEIAVMGLEAANDDVNVSKLLFVLSGVTGTDYSTLIDSVDMSIDGVSVATASPETVGADTYLFFDLDGDVLLTKDEVSKVTLTVETADFDSDDIMALVGNLSVDFYPGSISSDLETRMLAVNVTTSSTIVATNNFVDNADTIRAASLVAVATTNATADLVNGLDMFEFSLTANGDDAYVQDITVSVTSFAVTFAGLMDVEDDGSNVIGSFDPMTGIITFVAPYATNGYLISENDTVAFTIVGAGISTTDGSANAKFTLADNASTVTWDVVAAGTAYNGDDVEGLPTGVWTAK
jgi:predicted peroxiredoxin